MQGHTWKIIAPSSEHVKGSCYYYCIKHHLSMSSKRHYNLHWMNNRAVRCNNVTKFNNGLPNYQRLSCNKLIKAIQHAIMRSSCRQYTPKHFRGSQKRSTISRIQLLNMDRPRGRFPGCRPLLLFSHTVRKGASPALPQKVLISGIFSILFLYLFFRIISRLFISIGIKAVSVYTGLKCIIILIKKCTLSTFCDVISVMVVWLRFIILR